MGLYMIQLLAIPVIRPNLHWAQTTLLLSCDTYLPSYNDDEWLFSSVIFRVPYDQMTHQYRYGNNQWDLFTLFLVKIKKLEDGSLRRTKVRQLVDRTVVKQLQSGWNELIIKVTCSWVGIDDAVRKYAGCLPCFVVVKYEILILEECSWYWLHGLNQPSLGHRQWQSLKGAVARYWYMLKYPFFLVN